MASVVLAACGGAKDQHGTSARAAPPRATTTRRAGPPPVVRPTPFPGRVAYETAKQAVFRGELEPAIRALEQATSENPDFTEAWYQLGAARSNLAIATVESDESAAVSLFYDAVSAKRQAQLLMDQGLFWVWDEAAQAEARSDLANALEDVDEVMANEEALVAALRIYAAAR